MIKKIVNLIKENGKPFKYNLLNLSWVILLIVGPTTLCITTLNVVRKSLVKKKNNVLI